MPWYAAHAIMYVRLKGGRQDAFTVWENVLLIGAADGAEAERRAAERARLDEGDSDGSFYWNDQPAEWVFAGLRKVISVAHDDPSQVPGDGDEVTYSQFRLPDLAAVQRLASGGPVSVEYEE